MNNGAELIWFKTFFVATAERRAARDGDGWTTLVGLAHFCPDRPGPNRPCDQDALTRRQRGCRLDMGDQVKGLVRVRLDQVQPRKCGHEGFDVIAVLVLLRPIFRSVVPMGRIVVVTKRSLDLASIGARMKSIAAGRRLRPQQRGGVHQYLHPSS